MVVTPVLVLHQGLNNADTLRLTAKNCVALNGERANHACGNPTATLPVVSPDVPGRSALKVDGKTDYLLHDPPTERSLARLCPPLSERVVRGSAGKTETSNGVGLAKGAPFARWYQSCETTP